MDDLTPARVNQGASGPRAEAMGFGMGGAVETDPLGMIQRIAQYGVILTSKGARSRRLKVAKIAPPRAAQPTSAVAYMVVIGRLVCFSEVRSIAISPRNTILKMGWLVVVVERPLTEVIFCGALVIFGCR